MSLNFEDDIIKDNLEFKESGLIALVTQCQVKKNCNFFRLLLIIVKIKLSSVFTTYPAIVLSTFLKSFYLIIITIIP